MRKKGGGGAKERRDAPRTTRAGQSWSPQCARVLRSLTSDVLSGLDVRLALAEPPAGVHVFILVGQVEVADLEVQRVDIGPAAQCTTPFLGACVDVLGAECLARGGDRHLVTVGARHLRLGTDRLALLVGLQAHLGRHGQVRLLLLTGQCGQLFVHLRVFAAHERLRQLVADRAQTLDVTQTSFTLQ